HQCLSAAGVQKAPEQHKALPAGPQTKVPDGNDLANAWLPGIAHQVTSGCAPASTYRAMLLGSHRGTGRASSTQLT
ncbi:MAG: hypothetical protein ACJ8DY_14370, partial [Xanthobacteraceae bacterium]